MTSDDTFLKLCVSFARQSLDPSTRVGAVIVGPDGETRAAGFNRFPKGVEPTAERLADRALKNRLMVHGEMEAVLQAARVGVPLLGCTLYLAAMNAVSGEVWGGPPCTCCLVEVIEAGIIRVVTWPFKSVPSRWTDDIVFAAQLLQEAGIEYREVAK